MMRSTMIKTVAVLTLAISANYAGVVRSLYTDHRAVVTEDILTVLIVENAKAGSSTQTSTGKSNSFGVDNVKGSGPLDFIPAFGASGGVNTGFDGKGSTAREGSLIAKVSARVIEVLDNGNMVISGSKVVEINDEKEIIKVTGVVRPQDIETGNTIYSYNISDANITYSGKGVNDRARRPGIFARFFNLLF